MHCGVSNHAGHTLLVLAEAAPVARELLVGAAADSSGCGSTTVIEKAAAFGRLVTTEIRALPDRIAATEQRINEFRDTAVAAVLSRHAALRAVS